MVNSALQYFKMILSMFVTPCVCLCVELFVVISFQEHQPNMSGRARVVLRGGVSILSFFLFFSG